MFKRKVDVSMKNNIVNNNIMVFEGHNVEIFEFNGQVLFNPKHVAECLNIADVNSSIRNFNKSQVIKLKNSDMHDMQIRKLNNAGEKFLTESGVYKLIFKSHKEEAERFQDWVTDEVLPSIRKHGLYMTQVTLEKTIEDPDFLINILKELKKERELKVQAQKEKQIAEDQRDLLIHQKKLYTSTEIAKELGLNSAKKLNDILHQKGIQYKVNGTWVLYSDYSDLGYTSIKQKDFPKRVVYDRKWTGKGRAFILDLLEKEKKQNQNGKEETK